MKSFNLRHQTKKFTNKEYRKWFLKTEVPKFYNPYLHILFNVGALLSLIYFNFSKIIQFDNYVLLTFLLVFPIGNLVVWAIHYFPLHRRIKYWAFPYDAHTVQHHRFYTSEHILMENIREIFVIMFPWFVVLGFVLFVQPLFFLVVNYLLGADVAHMFCAATAGYFLLYEFVHTSNHLALTHPVFYIPGLRAMRKHHQIHHNPKLMGNYNMGIVFPLFDYILQTKWKEEKLPLDNVEDHFDNLESFS